MALKIVQTLSLLVCAAITLDAQEKGHKCPTGPEDAELLARAEKYMAIIAGAKNIEIYEGLPHQDDEPELLERELKRKDITKLADEWLDYPFYTPSTKATNEDELRKLLSGPSGIAADLHPKKCGFHPDYCIQFQHEKKRYFAFICMGCSDIIIKHGDETHSFIFNSDKLKPLLAIYDSKRPRYEIIDTHFHAMSNKPNGLDKAVEWLDENKVSRAIDHPIGASRPKDENEHANMLANFKKHEGRFNRFCIIKPLEVRSVEEAVEILEKEKKQGAIGFGEHYGKGLLFNDPANMRLFAACAITKLPVMFHMDPNQNKDTEDFQYLENALKSHPGCTFIAHGPSWWKQMAAGHCDRLLEKYPNLYADLSAGSGAKALQKDLEHTEKFMIKHRKKLLFGTDCGWWSLKPDASEAPQFWLMKRLELPADVKTDIYSGNAKRLFGFE